MRVTPTPCWTTAGQKQQELSRISVECVNAGIIKGRRRVWRMLQELVIKVPAPFQGRPDVGFSTRYPAQAAQAPLKDVPFIIEGPSGPMRFFFSSRRRHTRFDCDWSSDVCSSD